MELTKRPESGPPSISGLLTQFLHRRRTEWALQGDWSEASDSEFEPYQPAEVNVLEPRAVLDEALAAGHWLIADATHRAQFQAKHMRHVPDWPGLLRRLEPAPFVPFALGYFPQLVRDVQQLWRMDWRQWKPSPATTSSSGLWEWGELMLAQKRPAEALVAMAVLRVLGQTREARQLFRAIRGQAPSVWNVLLANEDGALAWQDGDFEAAAHIWESITSEAPPIHFNRGLGALLLGRTRQARDFLALAAARLPEVSPWHHLAHLYLLLTE